MSQRRRQGIMTGARGGNREWMQAGTVLFRRAATRLGPPDLAEPSILPGWTRAHVVSHVAANAEALCNLVRWARTGIRTPMYSSPQERTLGIERGTTLVAEELTTWLDDSIGALTKGLEALTDEQWQAEVVTAQGRTVTASELPWMRAREVCVHAVDLDAGVTFDDLPAGFLQSLITEVKAKRNLDRLPAGTPSELAAWLTGRPNRLADTTPLEPWL